MNRSRIARASKGSYFKSVLVGDWMEWMDEDDDDHNGRSLKFKVDGDRHRTRSVVLKGFWCVEVRIRFRPLSNTRRPTFVLRVSLWVVSIGA